MLTNLRVKNFKSWVDSGNIRLAPITVLFGTNSAGKTSIPQLLLLLKQTAASPDRQRVLHFGDSRTLVDVGTYAEMVYGHEPSRQLEIDLEWSLGQGLSVQDPVHQQNRYDGTTLAFHAKIGPNNREQPQVVELEYRLASNGRHPLDVRMRRNESDGKFELVSESYQFTRQPGRAWGLPPPLRFYGFPDEAMAYYQNTAFLADFVLELERLLGSIYYVGPLREYPKRLYLWSGEVPEHVGARGDRAIEAVLAAGDRRFNFLKKGKTKSLLELVAERLRSMELILDFEVKPLAKNRKEYEVLVQSHPRLPKVKLTDVGFGVSQVLPVIVECFYVPERSIVIFEQPEIHLHPKVQADLADLFIDAIHARENGEHRECQFIIESHSEHFLRRLQRRIAEEKLSPSDAALYFVRTQQEKAQIEKLDVDLFGGICNWPQHFFGDEMGDLAATTEAAMLRKKKAQR